MKQFNEKAFLNNLAIAYSTFEVGRSQRWSPRGRFSPRGHIFKSLALALKLKPLASNPTSPRKCPVLGLRTLSFDWLKGK